MSDKATEWPFLMERMWKDGNKIFIEYINFFLLLLLLNQPAAAAAFSANDSVQRITVQELNAKLDRGEDVVIIDNRTGRDYTDSKIKIKGAVRIPIVQLEKRYSELPADKEIVIYCT